MQDYPAQVLKITIIYLDIYPNHIFINRNQSLFVVVDLPDARLTEKRKVQMIGSKILYLVELSLLLCLVCLIYLWMYYSNSSMIYSTIYSKEVPRVQESSTKDQIEGHMDEDDMNKNTYSNNKITEKITVEQMLPPVVFS